MNTQETIWKFPLKMQGVQTLDIPEGAVILHIELQYGQVCVWALVNPKAKKTHRTFAMYGTGQLLDVSAEEEHIFTFSQDEGSFIWHVFERVTA